MNNLNLIFIISLLTLLSGCRKIELPEPNEEEAVFGFWSGQIGTEPLALNNDSMFMSTKITKDAILNINTFETTFTTLGKTTPSWILKYRDSKNMRMNADTSDLFYTSESRYLKASQINQTGGVVTHSLNDLTLGNQVSWVSIPGVSGEVKGGRHLSVENTDLGGINIVKANIKVGEKINSIEKKYVPNRGEIIISSVRFSGNKIIVEVAQQSQSSTLRYKWGQNTPGLDNTFNVSISGLDSLEVFDTAKGSYVKFVWNLEISNSNLKQPLLPFFTSNHSIQYPTLPNFSKMEIIYFDEDGNEYSTSHIDQTKPFLIKEIETFNKTNAQGQKVKKLDVEFSIKLRTANGSKSLEFTNVKGDIGFAYE